MLSKISSTISSSDHLWIQVFRASWYVIQVVSSYVCLCVYVLHVCTWMYTQLYRLCVYTYVYMCKCVYTENWFYLFLLPPNLSMEFCIFWVEGDIGGDMLSLIICLSYGLDQTLEGISCVCPRATYLCMCYRRNRWAVSQLESTIRMSGVSGRAFFFISPSFPSWLNLELLGWHLNTTRKGHFTSGSLHYTERVNSAGKGNPEDIGCA